METKLYKNTLRYSLFYIDGTVIKFQFIRNMYILEGTELNIAELTIKSLFFIKLKYVYILIFSGKYKLIRIIRPNKIGKKQAKTFSTL